LRPFYALVPVIIFLLLATGHAIRSGVQPDDAGYVALRVADNLRQGQGAVFNPGERCDLTDSPLWLVYLAVAGCGTHAPLVAQASGLLLGAVVLLLALVSPRLAVAGACASLFVALDGEFAVRATAGTSVTLAALYLLLFAALLRRSRGPASLPRDLILAAALAPLVRPELALVIGPATLGWGWSERRRRAWWPFVALCSSTAIYCVVHRIFYEGVPAYWQPWPPTVVGITSGTHALAEFLGHRPVLVLGALGALWCWVRGTRLPSRQSGLVAGLVVLGLFMTLPAAGGDVERGAVALLPLACVLAVESVWRATRTRLGLVVTLLLVVATPSWTWRARTEHPETHASYARVGQWLRTHARPGTVVGAREVGALAYYSGLQVEDVLGQASPRVAAARRVGVPRPYALAAADFAPMLRQEPDLVLRGESDPVPSPAVYVPSLDAVPAALRGHLTPYRWAGSPVWRVGRAGAEDAASPVP
jgi:hypothetical protein